MRKFYLFVMALFVQVITCSNVFAADPPASEYEAAMATIENDIYRISTEVDGVKWYITSNGGLVADQEAACLFTVTKVSGGALFDVGLNIDPGTGEHFSNTTLENDKAVLNPGTGVFRLDGSNNRNDWERQVPYMNEEGKIAIRSCNTAYGESSWADAGRAFWTYEIAEGEDFPTPCYSYEPAYIWSFDQMSPEEKILVVIENTYSTYEDYYIDPSLMDIGEDWGQHRDGETYNKFLELLELLDTYYYDPSEIPDGFTLDDANALKATLDSLFQVVLDSEVPYSLPNGDGYYRIISPLRYISEASESGYVDKAILAPYDPLLIENASYGTLKRENANYVWKLTQHGDSIAIENVGMENYISTASSDRVNLTTDADLASHVVFDYAGEDYVDTDDGNGDIQNLFYIRLASASRGGNNYFHQLEHNLGNDAGVDKVLSFWAGTFDKGSLDNTSDRGTSEWYLEWVPEEEVEELIANFAVIRDHDLLVAQFHELQGQVLETLNLAKDVIRTKQITSASQMESPYSDPSEGQHIEYLIDNDASTFWHTTWHGLAEGVEPFYYYGEGYEEGRECHYIQYTGMENAVGDMELYLRERDGADNDRVKTLVIMGTDNLKNADEDWDEIVRITLPNTAAGEENTVPFNVATAYPYWRLFTIETASASYDFRQFWHAAEIQFFTVKDNPNSQFNQLGDVAENLEQTYLNTLQTPDAAITLAIYQELLDAYNAFLEAGLVDPAELRDALTTYAKATEGVVVGSGPGYWSDASIAEAYQALYAEASAYNEAGVYSVPLIHKYSVMLKAMQKSVMEKANGIETDKWYNIMYPTEEMYDEYGFAKDGGDNCNELGDTQRTMWGTIVSLGKEVTVENTEINEDGEEVTTTIKTVEPVLLEDVRENTRLFFFDKEFINEPALSMFRFVEVNNQEEGTDYVAPFIDAKENMALALDMSTTYKKGDALITSAAQFSSNASYPGTDGQKLESGCLIDNNFATYWHSDYGRTYCAIPYLQVALNEPVSGLIQVYVGRRNTANGHVTRMYVQGSNDAEAWTNIGYIELPYTNATTPATSQPLELGGTYSYLRFSMTNRYGTDGGSNIEFDPFEENITADDYNTKYTYFHCSEFQIYPVTPEVELSASAQALQQAYNVANKVVLKDATAEDLAATSQAYRAYRSEFNAAAGKDVLPYGIDKAQPTYAIQNKATGLFVYVEGTGNQNFLYTKTIPTFVTWKALGYHRSLLSAKNIEGGICNNLHAGESNRRFCTWTSTEPASNSGLVICEADVEYAAPSSFTFFRDVNPGSINDWVSTVSLTPSQDGGAAYTSLGQVIDEDEKYLALKQVETIPAGEPGLYIYGDTTKYDTESVEPIEITMPGVPEFVTKGASVNGLTGYFFNHVLAPREIFFNGNYVECIAAEMGKDIEDINPSASSGYQLTGPCVALDLDICPVYTESDYDYLIALGSAAEMADGIENIPAAIEKISQRGNVYSMDGKLLMSNANLNSLKALGRGMYILNGVKVVVK